MYRRFYNTSFISNQEAQKVMYKLNTHASSTYQSHSFELSIDDKKYQEETEQAGMGSPMPPVAGNLYMGYFEQIEIQISKVKHPWIGM